MIKNQVKKKYDRRTCMGRWQRHDWEQLEIRQRCRRCKKLNPLGVSPAVRFWDKVDTTGNCWVWTGAIDYHGYGRAGYNRTSIPANRAAWIYIHGMPPKGLDVCHTCDNRRCVRPDHMYLGTRKQNLGDFKRKYGYWPGLPQMMAAKRKAKAL